MGGQGGMAHRVDPVSEIVKVQQSIYPVGGPLLIYNEDRSIEQMIDINSPEGVAIRNKVRKRLRSFWTSDDTGLVLGELLEEQGW